MHLLLGIQLLVTNTYDDVMNLVNQWIVQTSFLGRNALMLLNIQVLDLFQFIINLFFKNHLFEAIMILGSILNLFTKNKKIGLMNSISTIFLMIFVVIIFLLAIHAGTLFGVLLYIKIIGIALIVIYSCLLLASGLELIHTIEGYKEALKVEIIIIE
jgi:hypothetical protein